MRYEDARERARVHAAGHGSAAVTSCRATLTAGATRWQLQNSALVLYGLRSPDELGDENMSAAQRCSSVRAP
jgi:hypothetical protein